MLTNKISFSIIYMILDEIKCPLLFIYFYLVMTSYDPKITTSSVIKKFLTYIYIYIYDNISTITTLKFVIILPIYFTIVSIILAIIAFGRKYLINTK